MARTEILIQEAKENQPINGLVFTAVDVANGNSFDFTGGERIVVRNDGASPYMFTQSSKDVSSFGRGASTAQKTQTLAAGAYLFISGRDLARWGANLNGEDASLKVAIIRNVVLAREGELAAGYSGWYSSRDIDGDDTDNAAYTNNDPVTTWVDKGSLGADVTQRSEEHTSELQSRL